jgi:hypothetical protein
MALFGWGPLTFDVEPLNVHEKDHTTDSDWARKEIAGAPIYREWVGENDEEITLRGRVFPFRLGGLYELDVLEAQRRNAMPHPLLRGGNVFLGWFVIEKLARSHRFLADGGLGQLINFEATFVRVPMPDGRDYYPMMIRALGVL